MPIHYPVSAENIGFFTNPFPHVMNHQAPKTQMLEGANTVVAAPDGQAFVNPTGNQGMASASTGDVFTGIIGGLLPQKIERRTYSPSTRQLSGFRRSCS